MKRYVKELANDHKNTYRELARRYPEAKQQHDINILYIDKILKIYERGLITADEAVLTILNVNNITLEKMN